MMKYAPVFSSKKSRNLLKNRAARRKDPSIRKIRDGNVTSRWTDEEPATKEEQIAELKADLETGNPLVSKTTKVVLSQESVEE